MKKINLPLSERDVKELRAGESVLLSGKIYTARDCAHKRMKEYIAEGKPLPFDVRGATIYYAGPCPAKMGEAIGSCGPTTSARMNSYAPMLLNSGLKAIIGKGEMSEEVYSALRYNGGVYFAAIGGAGALYASKVKTCSLVAFPELLSEAVYELSVEDFPVVVAADAFGGNIYKNNSK